MVKKSLVRKTIKKDSGQQVAVSDPTITRIRELAWTGQHAQAIELATQALDMADYQSAPRQMDLLDLRAESYFALLILDAVEKDAVSMMQIAKAQGKPAYKAQALICKARVQDSRGREELAVRTVL